MNTQSHQIEPGMYCYLLKCWNKEWVGHVVKTLELVEDVLVTNPRTGADLRCDGWLVEADWTWGFWVVAPQYLMPLHQPIPKPRKK